MSVSQHPIALRLEQQVGGATKLLATVMALPLVDGIFPALIIAGILSSTAGIIETGILIFGGSATVAVILAEMEGSRKQMVASILLIGAVIIPVAAVEAALAPTFEGLLNLEIFERFAGLVILAIAAKTASSEFGEYLPSPGIIIGLGLVASLDPSGAALETSTEWVLPGVAAASIGVSFALGVALLSPQLKGRVDIDRFRFGSAVALGVLALPILLRPFGMMQTEAPIALAVLLVTALFAYDPDADGIGAVDDHDDDAGDDDDASDDATPGDDDSDDDPTDGSGDRPEEPPVEAPDDPPTPTPAMGGDATVMANGGEEEGEDPYGDDDDSRAPWL